MIHVVKHGVAFCGAGMPSDWPAGDRLVMFNDPPEEFGQVTCWRCLYAYFYYYSEEGLCRCDCVTWTWDDACAWAACDGCNQLALKPTLTRILEGALADLQADRCDHLLAKELRYIGLGKAERVNTALLQFRRRPTAPAEPSVRVRVVSIDDKPVVGPAWTTTESGEHIPEPDRPVAEVANLLRKMFDENVEARRYISTLLGGRAGQRTPGQGAIPDHSDEGPSDMIGSGPVRQFTRRGAAMTDEETMALCAIRYCIGRSSYIVVDGVTWARRWGGQSEQVRAILIRDLREATDQCDRGFSCLGMPMDEREWRAVLADLRAL